MIRIHNFSGDKNYDHDGPKYDSTIDMCNTMLER